MSGEAILESSTTDNTIQYILTRDEAISTLWKLMFRPPILLGSVIIFLFGVGSLVLLEDPSWVWAPILIPILFLVYLRRTAHKIVSQHPEFLEQQTLSFDDNGISIVNSVSTVQWPWSRIRGLIDDNDFFILKYDTLGSGAIIPKRSFSIQQNERFLSYMKMVT